MIKSSAAKRDSTSSAEATSLKNLSLAGIDLTNSISSLRTIGYGLISLWLLDILAILHPLKLLDPVWGFQILGQLVERVGVLLIALGLILLGDIQHRQKWELPLLKVIVRMTLATAIAYFCLVPLGIGNTVRIANLTDNQISTQAQAEINRLNGFSTAIATSNDPAEIQSFIARFAPNPERPSSSTQSSLPDLKQQANLLLKRQTKEVRGQAELAVKEKKQSLIKRSLKWNIGAILSGILLLLLWGHNGWIFRFKGNRVN